MGKLIIGLLLGCILGAFLGFVGSRTLTPNVLVQGTVKYQPKDMTAATAAPPEGFTVESVIYIDELTQEDIGKHISVEGQLGAIPVPESGQHFPRLSKIQKR